MLEMNPRTAAGERLVTIVEKHTETFRARARENDREGEFPVRNFEELAESGVMGAFVPKSFGGLGLESIHDWSVGIERLARADASTAIALNMHLGISRNVFALWLNATRQGEDEAARRHEAMLRKIAAGEIVICAPLSEPGTDFLRPRTTATPSNDGFVISGQKVFGTLSPIANVLAIHARVPLPDGERIGFGFVPMDTPGVELQGDWDALGMRASGSQSIVFRDCVVGPDAISTAGPVGRWSPRLLLRQTLGNLTLVAAFLGIAWRARELTVEAAQKQTKTRVGGTIGQSSGVQHRLGELDIELAAATAILDRTTERMDAVIEEYASDPLPLELAHDCMRDYQCAKWTVNQNAISIVSKAMDVCGGGAFMAGHELSRLYRDVRAGPFMQPFDPTQAREYIGRVAIGAYPEG